MMGKIMSEASHSIIGTLSAKPSDMETRTTHNEFSSLLAPGEDRSRPTSDEGREDPRGEEFLEQFISSDPKSAPAALIDGSRRGTDLPSDGASASLSEMDRFISHLLPTVTQTETANQDITSAASSPTTGQTLSGISTDQPAAPNRSYPNGAGLHKAELPTTGKSADKPERELGDVSKVAAIPIVFVGGPTADDSMPPVGDVDQKLAMSTSLQNASVIASKENAELSEDPNAAATGNRQAVESKSSAAFKPQIENRLQDRLVGIDVPIANNGATPGGDMDQKPAMGASLQNASVVANKESAELSEDLNAAAKENRQTVESKSPAAFRPQIENRLQDRALDIDVPIQSPMVITPTDIAQRDRNAKAPVKTTTSSDAEPLLSSTMMQAAGSDRKMQDLLDFRLDKKARVEASSSRQFAEIETQEPVVAADKPIKIETKSSIPDTEGLLAAGPADRNVEMAIPAHATAALNGQNSMQKTVSFDWNAPQFAERFASEISDLRINGDLKKFEINPRNMGRLEISLIAQGANEILQIEAESDAARDVIAQHSQAIQEMLKGQGRSDLILRIDLKENMGLAAPNGNSNFEQHDSADARQERSDRSPSPASTASPGVEVNPNKSTDGGRYA